MVGSGYVFSGEPTGFAAKFDTGMEWDRKRGFDCNCKVFGMSHWKDIYRFLEIKIPGRILITSDRQMTPPLWQKAKN